MSIPTPSFTPVRTSLLDHKVKRLVSQRTFIQPKLTVGQPNHRYEREADRVAEQVMRMAQPRIQRQVEPVEEEEEEGALQSKPLADQITPLVQRQVEPEEEEEEEPPQAKLADRAPVQRQEEEPEEEEAEALQTKPLADQTTPLVQRQVEPEEEEEEEPIQTKLAEGTAVQRQEEEPEEEEEEETIQTKRAGGRMPQVNPNVGAQIRSVRGGGQPLDPAARALFERRFGYDFSQVRVHTETNAAQSARAVNSRGFTMGGDIVLAPGHYRPGTSEGQRLLAHELTHVVQQLGPGSSRQQIERCGGISTRRHCPVVQRDLVVSPRPTKPRLSRELKDKHYRGFTIRRWCCPRGWLVKNKRRTRPSGLRAEMLYAMARSSNIYRCSLPMLRQELTHRTHVVYSAKKVFRRRPRFAPFANIKANEDLWEVKSDVVPTRKGPRRLAGIMQVKHGISPADAVMDVFKHPNLYAVECQTATMMLIYRAEIMRKGRKAFDRKWKRYLRAPGRVWGVRFWLRGWYPGFVWHGLGWKVEKRDDLIPGDVAGFDNPCGRGTAFQTENAIYLGQGLFYAHPFGQMTLAALKTELVERGNELLRHQPPCTTPVTMVKEKHSPGHCPVVGKTVEF